jgi:hypothetical protein
MGVTRRSSIDARAGASNAGMWGSRSRRPLLNSGDGSCHRFGMIAAVLLRLLYLIFQQVLGLTLPIRPSGSRGDGASLQVEARTYN